MQLTLLCSYALHVAFESKANVQVPSDREVSNSWVVVSWDPLTSVVDRNGNLQGAVAGFFVTYQVCIIIILYVIFIVFCMYSL